MENMAIKILAIGNSLENLSSLKTLIIEVFPSVVVLSALDGQNGLAAAAKEEPAVILIDTQIAGTDGFEFCRKLKSNRACAGIPIILLIPGKGKKESRKRALECGADAFLPMPIDKSELTAQIRAMIRIKNSSIEKQGKKQYHAASAKGRSWKLNRSDAETLRLLEALKNEQAMNEAILDSIQGYLFVYDENGRLIKWNKKHETMTGYSAEELSHMTLEKWFDGEDIVKVNAAVRDVFVKGYGEVEAQLLLKNGNKLMTRSSGVPFIINGKNFFAGIGVDITEQKRAEQQLKQSMKDLLESQRIARLGTWRLDLSTNVVMWSEELYKMYNFDPALPPPPYTEHMKLFTPESWNRLSTSLERTRTSGIPYELELETVAIGGSNGWMWVRGEAERDPEGNICSLWGATQDITEYKKREHEIKQSEERFQLLFNKAPLGYQSLDFDGNFIDVNQQWLDTLGYRKEEVIGKWFGDFLCPEYIEGFRKRFPIFKSQGFIHSEFEMRHKAGRRMTIAFEGKIGYSTDGTFKQTHCILQDITSQRMAEQALADSEERYRCLFEYSGVGIGYFTKSGEVISYNRKALENLGGKLEDYVGKSVGVLFPKREAEILLERIEKAVSCEHPQEYEDFFVLNSGSKWLTSTFTRIMNSNGELAGVQVASVDITERKMAEEALMESEAILKAAFENSQAGIAIADAPDGKLRYVNKAGLQIINISEEESAKNVDIGNYVDSLRILHLDGTPFRKEEIPLARAVLYGEAVSEEFVIRRDDGEDRYVFANAVPIKDSNDNKKAGMVLFLDITEKRQAENRIRKQNELFTSLLKILPVGVFMVDGKEGGPLVANDMAKALLGRGIMDEANEDTLAEVYQAYKGDTKKRYPSNEMPIVLGMKGIDSHIDDMVVERPDGSRVLLEVFGTSVKDENYRPWASLVTFINITERKKTENELLFLSYHDQLTGFYNRRYFEDRLRNLDKEANLPLSIIICDINGLKLVNDSFGHDFGDRLIKRAAETIREACRADDIVSRIGGDEFAVILPNTDVDILLSIVNKIKKLAQKQKVENIDLSLSCGYDTKKSAKQSIGEVMANAENHMYRHKLYEHSSMRSKTIDIIMKTLFEKSSRESQHSNRVSTLCKAIAEKMDFDKDDVNKIGIAGLVHDIGKIGIDEKTLR